MIGDLSRWIVIKDPTPEFWTYHLLDFGLYSNSGLADDLVNVYRATEFQSSLKELASELNNKPSKGEITVRFFYSAYQDDAEACLGLMNQVYQAYKKDGVDFNEYPALEEIENHDITDPEYEGNSIDYNPRVEKVYPSRSKFEIYQDIHSEIQKVENEVVVFDSYINEDLIELYLRRLPENISIKILTKNIQGDFEPVHRNFAKMMDDGCKFGGMKMFMTVSCSWMSIALFWEILLQMQAANQRTL